MQAWTDKPAPFEALVEPLREALNHLYQLHRINEDTDVDYDGYNVGSLGVNLSADESLRAENLRWQLGDQGRDAAEILLSIAVGIGIEQGRRLEQEEQQEADRFARLMPPIVPAARKTDGG